VWLFFALWLGWLLLAERAPIRRMALASVALVPAFVFLVLYRAWLPPEIKAQNLWHPIGTKLGSLLHVPFLAADGALEVTLSLLFLAGALLACLGEREPDPRPRLRRWGGLSALMLALWLLLPHCLGGLSFLYQRFLTPFQLFLIPCAAQRIRRRVLFLTCALALWGIALGASFAVFRAFDHETRAMKSCLDRIEPGQKLIGMMGKRAPEGVTIPLYLHVDNYYTYWKLGRVYAHSMEQLPATPVYFRAPGFNLPIPYAFDWRPWALDWEHDGKYARYFLIHDGLEVPDAGYLKEGFARSHLVCQEGEWRLYENSAPAPLP
jgi:hypothetical protein